MDKIKGLTQDLAFYARNVDARESMKRLDVLRDEKDAKERAMTKLTQDINDLSNKVEDLMAENRTLRKMANVPKNYGINLEQVKLHDREKIDDYKKLIRVLQDDNYRLEEERAKLKHMLKQQSMMYKQEPSQRYKGLT
jgi:regulator of replication initiation timing